MRSRGLPLPTQLRDLCLLSAAIVLLLPGGAQAGTVSGLVTTAGQPGARPLDPKANPVVVWVDGPKVSVPPVERPVLAQRSVQFSSPLLVAVAGQTVDMPNDDDVAHNVYSLSGAKRFNLGIYDKGKMKSVTFDEVGLVDVLCSIHRRMTAKILVVPNPYYALTAAGSRYQIKGIPAGTYSLHTWSKGLPDTQQGIVVTENGELTLNLSLADEK